MQASLPGPAPGQPCRATAGDLRESNTERAGHDAVSLVETTQMGGHANETQTSQPAVQCADGELAAVQTAGHGGLDSAPVPGTNTSELAPQFDNKRPTFGVGGGTSAQQQRLESQCTLQVREAAVIRESQPMALADSSVKRPIPAATERPHELELPRQASPESE